MKYKIPSLLLLSLILAGCGSTSSSHTTNGNGSEDATADPSIGNFKCQLGNDVLSSSSQVKAGQQIHCFLGMGFAGNGVAKDTHVKVQFPTEFTGIQGVGATLNGSVLDWNLGNVTSSSRGFEMTAYASTSIDKDVTLNATLISSTDNNTGNNTASVQFKFIPKVAVAPLLALTGCLSNTGIDCEFFTVKVGSVVDYTINITNKSDKLMAKNVKFTFDYDKALLRAETSQELDFGTLNPGESKTLHHKATVLAANSTGLFVPITMTMLEDDNDPYKSVNNLRVEP